MRLDRAVHPTDGRERLTGCVLRRARKTRHNALFISRDDYNRLWVRGRSSRTPMRACNQALEAEEGSDSGCFHAPRRNKPSTPGSENDHFSDASAGLKRRTHIPARCATPLAAQSLSAETSVEMAGSAGPLGFAHPVPPVCACNHRVVRWRQRRAATTECSSPGRTREGISAPLIVLKASSPTGTAHRMTNARLLGNPLTARYGVAASRADEGRDGRARASMAASSDRVGTKRKIRNLAGERSPALVPLPVY
jgi:hypothetical protein